jgi:hypothetical protein
MKFHSHYKKLDTGFLSRIPSGKFGLKKREWLNHSSIFLFYLVCC